MNDIREVLETVAAEIIDLKKYEILGHVSRCGDPKQSLKWLNVLAHEKNFEDASFKRLWGVLYWHFLGEQCESKKGRYNEFYIQGLFKKHVSSVIKGATIVKKKMNPHHMPDAFIRFYSQAIPVEMKKGPFDLKALNQLKRYCKVYKSRKGVAVGSELTVKLPAEWIFVSTEELLSLESEKPEEPYKPSLNLTPLECVKLIKSEIILGLMEKDYWGSQLGREDKNKAHLEITKAIMSLFWPNPKELFINFNLDYSTPVWGLLHPGAFDEI